MHKLYKRQIRYVFMLGLVCFVSGLIVALVYAVNEPQSVQQQESADKTALKEVLPRGETFKPYLEKDKIVYYSAYDRDNKLVGFVYKTESRGYSSKIELMTSLDLNLEIIEVKVLSQNETPRFGGRITKRNFLDQFKGKGLGQMDKVLPIAQATISSSSAINAVKEKLTYLAPLMHQEIKRTR